MTSFDLAASVPWIAAFALMYANMAAGLGVEGAFASGDEVLSRMESRLGGDEAVVL